jgi:hypothetical protein
MYVSQAVGHVKAERRPDVGKIAILPLPPENPRFYR